MKGSWSSEEHSLKNWIGCGAARLVDSSWRQCLHTTAQSVGLGGKNIFENTCFVWTGVDYLPFFTRGYIHFDENLWVKSKKLRLSASFPKYKLKVLELTSDLANF